MEPFEINFIGMLTHLLLKPRAPDFSSDPTVMTTVGNWAVVLEPAYLHDDEPQVRLFVEHVEGDASETVRFQMYCEGVTLIDETSTELVVTEELMQKLWQSAIPAGTLMSITVIEESQ